MADALRGFLHRFVFPLLEGGTLRVGAPLTAKDIRKLEQDAGALGDARLLELRQRRASLLVADGLVELPEIEELHLWAGLYNVLALDHPDLGRIWASERTWGSIERETRTLLTLPPVENRQEALARHVTVGAFTQILRDDFHIPSDEGERVYLGQLPGRGRRGVLSSGEAGMSTQTVRWVQTQAHPAARRAFELALWSSPLTCVLYPELAPARWTPLGSGDFLDHAPLLRAVVYHWERQPDWLALGSAMLRRLPGFDGTPEMQGREHGERSAVDELQGRSVAALVGDRHELDPMAFERMLCLLIHLHLLKVLDFDVRIGLGRSAREDGMQSFLALPLTLDLLEPRWGQPLCERQQPRLFRRWKEYLSHLEALLAVDVIDAVRQAIASAQSPQGSFA